MKNIILTLLIAVTSFNSYASQDLKNFNNSYGKLLQKHVKLNQAKDNVMLNLVDYKPLKTSRELLKTSSLIKFVKVDDLTKNEQLAFWINAYNFYTLELVAKNIDDIKSIKDLGWLLNSVWDKYKFEIDGNKYSLNNIEHNIIRTKFKEPRVHFALVCASISCPDLLNAPYLAETLDEQLNSQTQSFLDNYTKGVVEKSGMVRVSKIFKWYGQDFNKGNALSFIQEYKEIDYKHGYIDYNWKLNSLND